MYPFKLLENHAVSVGSADGGSIEIPYTIRGSQAHCDRPHRSLLQNWAAGGPGGRIWLVDPETAKVMGGIRTGDNPDFALSPDGSRLYVEAMTEGDSSELA